MIDISERNLEATIEAALLAGGADGTAGARNARETEAGAFVPGGYSKRSPEDYNKALCLLPRDVLDFIYATQPKEWDKFKKQHGADAKDKLLQRLDHETRNRGTLEVLRRGIKADGCKFQLAYFRPASGLNEAIQRLYHANIFSVVRQVKYSARNENSLDLVLFLNGLPIITAELKNPLTQQTVEDAVKQYRTSRDPREPLFAFGRCLGHFAVDPDLVYMTTHLRGPETEFLPFNQGRNGGAGNPPSWKGFSTAYLWEQTWARDSMLDLIQNFIQVVDELDDNGKKTGKKKLIFPRYHQLDCVRRLLAHARAHGAGQHYLIHHSAGSGKSNSIAWLAHQLVTLHSASDQAVFDSVVVITDRRILDHQLQQTVRQFEQTLGVVENIDKTSRQLKTALEDGKKIIVTTLQKFPVIAGQMGALPGHHFAVIIDEAHSSQGGESTRSVKSVLAAGSLEEAEREEAETPEDTEDRIIAEMKKRGRLPNVSYFAFTATPKRETLQLFGTKQEDGTYAPFSLYSMRQAIEEHFILDVLENYTTYRAYWSLLKKIADDPRYDHRKASYLLRSFVDLHEHTVAKKVAIMADHFAGQVAFRIGGKAKAMIVTRSRLHAVRYKIELDRYLKEKGYPFKALVAFSGQVRDPDNGLAYTETQMNHFAESKTAETFKQDDYRILVVAEKFQTGFDQPLLHTMYVDKRLSGLHAVQTLSRLNRVHPGKEETMVLDFSNEAADIQKAFQPYYDKTLLAEGTDPNLLYDLQTQLSGFDLYTQAEVNQFANIYFDPKGTADKLHAALSPVTDRYQEAALETQTGFRTKLADYVRLYSFLAQVITFTDADLERLYVFARLLLRKLRPTKAELPAEVQQNIDIDSYRLQETSTGKIGLQRGRTELEPVGLKPVVPQTPDQLQPLSQIIKELNERFGTDLGENARVSIQHLEARLASDPALEASIRANTRDNARLTFDHVVNDRLQEMVDSDFKFYKQVTDDDNFSKALLDWLFERFYEAKGGAS
ncbi:MAG: type I restriction endonuclease [Chloroflexi bacterium]|nr:type I restriction endonuclease [Chloroflexota bacterium]